MRYIVSANYRNRSSAYRWLIRRADEPMEAARACKRVECRGVTFEQASHGEAGFGCRMVANCEHAEGADFEGQPLHFDGVDFRDELGRHVNETQTLSLAADGAMNAVL